MENDNLTPPLEPRHRSIPPDTKSKITKFGLMQGDGPSSRKCYRKHFHLRERVVGLAAEGMTVPVICQQIGIRKQLAHYHIHKALEGGGLSVGTRSKPNIYTRGRNYNAFISRSKGRGVVAQVQIQSRTHQAPGAAPLTYKVIKPGDIDDFEERSATIYTKTYELPLEVTGYNNAQARATFIWTKPNSKLQISPPYRLQSLDDIQQESYPFVPVGDYVFLDLRKRGWDIDIQPILLDACHYAFDCNQLHALLPGVLDGVEQLKREEGGQREGFWIDMSQGRAHPEFETSNRNLALDLLAVLNVVCRGSKGTHT